MKSLPFKTQLAAPLAKTNKRQLAIWIGVGAALIIIAVASFLLLNKPAAKEQHTPVLTVAIEPVALHPLDRRLTVTGTVWAFDPLSLGAEINGLRIQTVDVEEGDTVVKGQVLATLNSSLVRAALEKELARLKASRAHLVKTIQPNRPAEMTSIQSGVHQMRAGIKQEEANVVRARANLENARRNSARYIDLAKQGAVSTKEADDRKTAEDMARAELKQAEEKLAASRSSLIQAEQKWNLAVEGGRKEDIMISQSTVEETQANINQLEAQLAQTVIRAPANGLITKRDAHIGDISTVTKPLFFMIRDSRLEVRAEVPEADLARLQPGQIVQFQHPTSGQSIAGKVRLITPQVDPSTRLAVVRIDIPFERNILPGMFVRGTVEIGKQNVMAVPSSAVISRDDRSMVFVTDGDRVSTKTVTLGDSFGDRVEITAGLSLGEPVVVVGSGFLKDGDYVKIGKK